MVCLAVTSKATGVADSKSEANFVAVKRQDYT